MRLLSLVLPFVFGTASAAAQGFEGVISMTVLGNGIQEMHWSVKGGRSAAAFNLNSTTGILPIRYFVDEAAKTNTMLMPLRGAGGPGSAGVQITSTLESSAGDAGKTFFAPPKKLGTSQQIAGITCDDYQLGDAAHTLACIATGMGLFAYPTMPTGGAGSADVGNGSTVTPKLLTKDQVAAMAPTSIQAMKAASAGTNSAFIVSRSETNDLGVKVTTYVTTPVQQGDKSVSESSRTQTVVISNPNEDGTTKVTLVDGQVTAVNGKPPTAEAMRAIAANGVTFAGMTTFAQPEPPVTIPQWVDALGTAGFPLKVWAKNGTTHLLVTEATPGTVPDAIFVIPDGFPALKGGGGLPSPR